MFTFTFYAITFCTLILLQVRDISAGHKGFSTRHRHNRVDYDSYEVEDPYDETELSNSLGRHNKYFEDDNDYDPGSHNHKPMKWDSYQTRGSVDSKSHRKNLHGKSKLQKKMKKVQARSFLGSLGKQIGNIFGIKNEKKAKKPLMVKVIRKAKKHGKYKQSTKNTTNSEEDNERKEESEENSDKSEKKSEENEVKSEESNETSEESEEKSKKTEKSTKSTNHKNKSKVTDKPEKNSDKETNSDESKEDSDLSDKDKDWLVNVIKNAKGEDQENVKKLIEKAKKKKNTEKEESSSTAKTSSKSTTRKPKKSKAKTTGSPSQVSTSSTTPEPEGDFEEEALEASNQYREKHGAPALTLNDDLTKRAQEWANNISSRGVMEHSSKNSKYGENIYFTSESRTDGKAPVDAWYSEVESMDWNCPDCHLSETGHFTQLVWVGTKEFGIAKAKGKNGIYVVAKYNPAGNYIGDVMEDFAKNVLKAD